jgi:16S rRNA processing protein RimM
MEDNKIVMGKIASPYGVRGWSKVVSFADPIDNLLNYTSWEIKHQNRWQTVTVEKGKIHGKWLIVKLAVCHDREQAKLYTNDLIAIDRTQLAPTKTNEYYWSDLIGLTVVNVDGTNLGVIDSIMETGANDVIVIKNQDNRQILIPYIKQVVKSIDLADKKMLVDWETEK